MQFRWDPAKAVANSAKHGVTFEEAATVFGDPVATTVGDPRHSTGEDRFLTTGRSNRGHVIIVWHTYESGWVRIIGARRASRRERRVYEAGD